MKRLRVGEVMDQPGLDCAAHAHALRSLNRANRLFRVDARLWQCVRRLAGDGASVLDIACGGGGFLRYAGEESRGVSPRLIGLDRSLDALRYARCEARASSHADGDSQPLPTEQWHTIQGKSRGESMRWIAGDALRLPFADGSVDVAVCSLFLHHFDSEESTIILREAARVARRGVIIGELVRSWPAWVGTYVVTRALSRSWIFHTDGPRSVRASFRAGELQTLAGRAGMRGAHVRRVFPFRYIMIWQKPAENCTHERPL